MLAWSGSEVLLWGGTQASGAAWSPATDSWRPLPTVGQPSGFRRTDGVWTGTELIIWGGADSSSTAYQSSGARYDPLTNQWRPMSAVGAPSARWLHRVTWTGSELMVFGGYGPALDGGSDALGDGALYDPVADSWRSLPSLGAPSPRYRPELVRAGNEVIVFGGSGAGCLSDGARFNPTTNVWTPMSTVGAPAVCGFVWSGLVSAWTGSELLLVGGYNPDPLIGGYRYTPSTDSWSTLPRGDPCDLSEPVGVWTGAEFVVWGGARYSGCPVPYGSRRGYRYRPATNGWVPMTLTNQPNLQERSSGVWTGSEVVLSGGRQIGGAGVDFTARYQP